MKRSISLVFGFVLVASLAGPAWAQRGRNAGVVTPYGSFNANGMKAAGGDPVMAGQLREQRQMMQYQQILVKQQQQYMQMMKKQEEYLKKHPEEAAKYQAQLDALRPTKKATTKTSKKGKVTTKSANGSSAKPEATSSLDNLPTDAATNAEKTENAVAKKAKKSK